jgi:hypothetical protein
MAHVAMIDPDGIVRDVQRINNDDLPDGGAFTPSVEQAATDYQDALGLIPEGWSVRLTSYSGSFRGRYAGQGYAYDEPTDQFVPPGFVWDGNDWIDPNPQPLPDQAP